MRRELIGNLPKVAGSSPISGRDLAGNLPEVVESSLIGGQELAGSSSEVCRDFDGSSLTGDRELAGGPTKGCREFAGSFRAAFDDSIAGADGSTVCTRIFRRKVEFWLQFFKPIGVYKYLKYSCIAKQESAKKVKKILGVNSVKID
ncbi:hypothetical protein GW17_00061782 [Ensete ventricosum]|nr:hypothetical protein GW17_00061782 [Ensete ventricosum]